MQVVSPSGGVLEVRAAGGQRCTRPSGRLRSDLGDEPLDELLDSFALVGRSRSKSLREYFVTIRTIASTCRRSVRSLALISVGLTGGALLSPATAHADPAPMCCRGPDENVYYKITNVESGESLNVSHRLQANGAPVIQWEYAGAANEQWRAVCVAPFSYKLVARHSGLVLEGGSALSRLVVAGRSVRCPGAGRQQRVTCQ